VVRTAIFNIDSFSGHKSGSRQAIRRVFSHPAL